jgi:hypothetical protein
MRTFLLRKFGTTREILVSTEPIVDKVPVLIANTEEYKRKDMAKGKIKIVVGARSLAACKEGFKKVFKKTDVTLYVYNID